MAVLGNLGNFYIVLLFLFLIGGAAVIALNFSRNLWDGTEKIINNSGGKMMNKWLKLAITSFVGILIASFALGLITNGSGQNAHAAHSGGNYSGIQQTADNGTAPIAEAQIYQMQMNLRWMQQELSQLMQKYQMNYGGMNGMPGYMNGSWSMNNQGTGNAGMGNTNMNNMGMGNTNMNNMGMGNTGSMNNGGMGMR